MRKARNIFWVIFLLSLGIGIYLISLAQRDITNAPPGQAVPGTGIDDIALWLPVITTISSLFGAVTTTIITIKRDRLELRKTDLELAKMQLELVKLQKDTEIELEKKQRELEELQRKDQQSGDKQNN